MSMSNAFETDLLEHIFQNLSITLIGDATGLPASATAGVLYVGLASADPGETGTQSTSELSYTGYARVSVVRSSAGWTVSGNTASNAALITFGACTAGSGTAAYYTVGTSSTGTGYLIGSGQISSPSGGLAISVGVTPEVAIGAFTITAD